MKKVLLGMALAALVFVPAAAATRSHRVRLALVPLPRSAIGPAVQSFSLAHDSGRVSNASAAAHTSDATPKTFKKLGRVDGYALEYGNAFTGDSGTPTSARALSSTRPRRTPGGVSASGRRRTPGSASSTIPTSRSPACRSMWLPPHPGRADSRT